MDKKMLEKRALVFERASDGALLGALAMLDAKSSLDEAERMTYAWTVDELERRHPEISGALDAAFSDDAQDRTYGAVLASVLS